MEKIISLFPAKSCKDNSMMWLPFTVHSYDTAGIIERLFNHWIPESLRIYISEKLLPNSSKDNSQETAVNFCRLMALLHDTGKLTPAFQSKIAPNIYGYSDKLENMGINIRNLKEISKSPHNIAGQVILEHYGFPKEISVITGSHHGRCAYSTSEQLEIYKSNYFGYKSINEKLWRNIRKYWIDTALKETGFKSVEDIPKPNVKIQMLITGLLIMSDWIASNTKYFPYINIDSILSEEQIFRRLEYAWKKLSLPESLYIENINNSDDFFKERFEYTPNDIQKDIMETVRFSHGNGIYIIESPMGTGKTETALAVSEIIASVSGAGGIYFGLPTQATANGIFGRIKKWAESLDDEKHSIRLAHGMTELNSEYQQLFHGRAVDSGDESLVVHEWFEGRKQALLSDFVIATVDQFLLASLKQKHVMLRHLGLAGKIVIIDECHAYDAYMNVYLDHTLRWMGEYEVSVIILSATLPPQRRNELIKAYTGKQPDIEKSLEYPVLTWTDSEGVHQKALKNNIPEKHIKISEIKENELIFNLSDKLSDGGCASIIVNSVSYAQKLALYIEDKMPEYHVICFHSRFTASDRADIERNILSLTGKESNTSERNKLIVVGTQVLEQSLDIDFDYMITEICPMDLLLQRSGRLQRHKLKRPEKLKNAELAILRPEIEKKSVYSPWIIKMTEKYLPEKLIIPSDIPFLVSSVYAEPQNTEEKSSDEYRDYIRMINDKKSSANKYCIKSNQLNSRYKNTIAYFLDDDAGNSKQAEASVRDSDESIEVLILKRKSSHEYMTVSGNYEFDTTLPLSDSEAKIILNQRIRLPLYFSGYRFNETIESLEAPPKRWQESQWLKGELLVILDSNNEAEISGRKIRYSSKYGLEMSEQR